jgi:hypothetical protein
MGTKLETLSADLAERFATATGVAVPFVVGERKRHAHAYAAPPVVFWTMGTGGTIAGPQLIGRQSGGKARELASKSTAVDLHVWAATTAQAEAIHEALLALFLGVARWCVPMGDWHWVTEEPAEAGFTVATAELLQSIKIATPILDLGHDLRSVVTLPDYQAPAVDAVGFVPGSVPQFEILTAGERGTATFRWTLDGGAHWYGPLATGELVALGSTGMAVAFQAGTYQVGAIPPPPTLRAPLTVTIHHVAATPGALT